MAPYSFDEDGDVVMAANPLRIDIDDDDDDDDAPGDDKAVTDHAAVGEEEDHIIIDRIGRGRSPRRVTIVRWHLGRSMPPCRTKCFIMMIM